MYILAYSNPRDKDSFTCMEMWSVATRAPRTAELGTYTQAKTGERLNRVERKIMKKIEMWMDYSVENVGHEKTDDFQKTSTRSMLYLLANAHVFMFVFISFYLFCVFCIW